MSEKIWKIKIPLSALQKDILEFLASSNGDKIALIFPRNFPPIAENRFLEKAKKAAPKSEIFWVVSPEFLRKNLESRKFKTVAKSEDLPEIFENAQVQNLQDFLKSEKISAAKNQKPNQKPKNTSQSAAKKTPNFRTRKIESVRIRTIRGYVFFGFLLFGALLAGLLILIAPSAKVVIKPKISAVQVTQNILVQLPGSDVPEINQNLPAVDGVFMQTEIGDSEVFPTTGRSYQLTNAGGKVTIFNETSKPKFLLPSRLSTENGVIFRFGDSITVPPKVGDESGSIAVRVVADQYDENERPIGDRGNILAGTRLFFPALRSESRRLFFAKANLGPLTGGSTLTNFFVGENDFENAKKVLLERFRVRAAQQLKNEVNRRAAREGKNFVLLETPELLQIELLESDFPENLIGVETQTFAVWAKVKLSGIVFDESEVVALLAEKIADSQDHQQKLIEVDPNSIQYRLLEEENFADEKWLKLSVELQGVQTLDLDEKNLANRQWTHALKKEIAGQSPESVRRILANHSEIESVEGIEISPFWADALPKIFDQISFEIAD